MVTATRLEGNNELAKFAFDGLSTDEKPTGYWGETEIKNGSYFVEMDTKSAAFYDGATKTWN